MGNWLDVKSHRAWDLTTVPQRSVIELVLNHDGCFRASCRMPDGLELTSPGDDPGIAENLIASFQGLTGQTVTEGGLIAFGRKLSGALGTDICSALAEEVRSKPARIALNIDRSLMEIPWEFLYLADGRVGFVAQHPHVRIHRVSSRTLGSEIAPTPKVDILLVAADPGSPQYPPLVGIESELDAIRESLSRPECRGMVLDVLEHATPNTLSRRLETRGCKVFHFVGHGGLRSSGGVLAFESHLAHEHAEVYADTLAAQLVAAGTNVAFLSGCCTGGSSVSIGEELSAAGIPAVVGMQFEMPDIDAHLFARSFYASVACGSSLEDALYEGRMAIRGSGLGWGAPISTTNHPNLRIIDLGRERKSIRGNLPKPITSFIGRASEIAEVCGLLKKERLIILHGSGGIGKTRLSIEIGRSSAPDFSSGVWQVQLDSVTDPAGVVDAIAAVFGIRDSSEKSIEERMFEFLSDQELLLILDNCEHLVTACRSAAQRILQSCPRVKILATSREVLGTGCESVVPIPPLSYPDIPEDDVPCFPVNETIRDHEALQLFVTRSQSADSRFQPTSDNILDVCKIAKRLDGIPLALELAASRVRSFSPSQIFERLKKDLAWLDVENPGAADRHKTIRAAIEWSYRLLSNGERTLFNRLSIFPDRFTLEGVEAVCDLQPLRQQELSSSLSSLVDKSLVVAEQDQDIKVYRLLDSCRAFARQALDLEGEVQSLAGRQFAHICDVVAELEDLRRASGQTPTWLYQMNRIRNDLPSAFEWALGEGGRLEMAAKLAIDCVVYWLIIGQDLMAVRIMDRALTSLSSERNVLWAKLALESGFIKAAHGDASALLPMQEAYEIISSSEPSLRRYASHKLGNAAYDLGRDDLAAEVFTWILDSCRETGNLLGEGSVQRRLAYVEMNKGNYALAKAHLMQNAEHKAAIGDPADEGIAWCALGYLETLLNGQDADELYRRGIRMLIPIENYAGLPDYLTLASSIYLEADPNTAAKLQGYSQRVAEESGYSPERFVTKWAKAVEAQSREKAKDYDALVRIGRTMSSNEVLDFFA